MIWVLYWEYSDHSAAGVLRAYKDEKRANEDLELLNKSESCKTWKIVALSVWE